MDFFLQDGDETRLKNAQLADDMDLLYSKHHIGPWGPELVACAMRAGAHVCWYCQELYSESGKNRPIEIRHGFVLLLLHAGCIGKKPRSFRTYEDLVRGHQLRREATKVVKGSAVLDYEHAKTADSSLSLDGDLFASARNLLERQAKAFAETSEEMNAPEDAPESVEDIVIHLAEGLDTLAPRDSSGDNAPD